MKLARATRPLVAIAVVIVGVLLLAVLALQWINRDGGRAFVAGQIAQLAPRSGLRVSVGSIEGRPLSRLVARDVVLSDPRGRFLEIAELRLDWNPLAFARNRLVLNEVIAPSARLLRLPELIPSEEEDQPLLPGFDIALGRLEVARLVVEPPVAGSRQVLALSARADIAGGRAIVAARARGGAGDRLVLDLDARPDDDRFDIDARLDAPPGGLVAGLAGLDQPLALTIAGDGSWARWRGTLAADLGARPLARARIAGSDGRFTLAGTAAPAPLLPEGPIARLAGPAVRFEATAAMADDRLRLDVRAASPALTLAASGPIDLERGRAEGIRVSGRLLRPQALLDSLAGPPIGFQASVDGPFAAATIRFAAATPMLRIQSVGLDRPRVEGALTLRDGPLVAPVRLTAVRATGLGETLGALATNLVVEGPITVAGGRAGSNALVLRTDRIRARGSASLDLASGAYRAQFAGEVPRYALPGVGVADLDARLTITPGAGGGLAIAGPFRARVRTLEAASLRTLAGGLPVVTGTARVAPSGAIAVDALRIAAPRLTLAGTAALSPDGGIAARLAGRSADYGPVTLAVSGTMTRPALDVVLARPGFGLGLAGLSAQVRPTASGFAVTARGRSDYGPFEADAAIRTGRGPLTIDIAALRIAGLTARGRIAQSGAVYAGELDIGGSGIAGDVTLANVGGVQRVAADVRFDRARLPLDPVVTIREGRITGTAMLRPAGPDVTGEARLAGVTRDGVELTRATASGRYVNGTGSARAELAGEADAPFTLAANLALAPDRVTLAANGAVAGEPVRLAQPAVVVRDGSAWRLQPATLLVAGGRATVAGTLGGTSALTARLDNLKLDTLATIGALNIRGLASGDIALTLPPGGLPNGTARMRVTRFSRAGLAVASLPVEIETSAALRGTTAAVRGYIRREGRVLGAFQAQLSPIPGGDGDDPLQRLLAAPMRGQLRLQAPAEAVWPLAGVEALDVRGPVAVSADLGGRLGEPIVRGIVRANGARLENAALGTVITAIELDGAFDGPRLVIRGFTGKAGDGSLSATGSIAYTAARGLTADLAATLANAQLIRLDSFRAAATGPARIRLDRAGGLISGDLKIDRARYQLGGAAIETIPVLAVTETGTLPNGRRIAEAQPTQWRLEIAADANNRIEVRGLGLDSEWSADVALSGQATEPRINGRAQLLRGDYDFAGKTFKIDRGDIRFQGEYPPNPIVDIQATARVQNLTAQISITGSALRPEVRFSSVPALPDDEVLSRLLFGTSVADLSAPEALQLAAAVAQLQGGGSGGGLNPVNALRRATGLDRLRVAGADKTTGQGTTVAAGKYIGDNIYLELATDARGYTATQIEVALTRSLSILSSVASAGGNRVSVRLSRDY